jgi:16S rRNA (guanine966-N2)-methyltransferase
MRIIAGRFRGRPLMSPPGLDVRPTSDRARQAVFNILENRVGGLRRRRVLDLFAGTGAMGLEALSRGAACAVFVEKADPAIAAIRHNIAKLQVPASEARVIRANAARLPRAAERYDLALLDPPYGSGLAVPAIESLQAGGWLEAGAELVVEAAAGETFAWPKGLETIDERRYGAARFWFLRMGEEAPLK